MRKPGEHTLSILNFLLDNPEWIEKGSLHAVTIEMRYCEHVGTTMQGPAEKITDDVYEALAIIRKLDARYQRNHV